MCTWKPLLAAVQRTGPPQDRRVKTIPVPPRLSHSLFVPARSISHCRKHNGNQQLLQFLVRLFWAEPGGCGAHFSVCENSFCLWQSVLDVKGMWNGRDHGPNDNDFGVQVMFLFVLTFWLSTSSCSAKGNCTQNCPLSDLYHGSQKKKRIQRKQVKTPKADSRGSCLIGAAKCVGKGYT